MARTTRGIGPVGAAARVLAGFGLLYIAGGANGLSWGIEWQDAIIGLIALPVLMVAFGLAARRYARGPVNFTGPLGIALNLAVIVALIANDHTGGGATIFYGTMMLIAAWRGQAGCEGTRIGFSGATTRSAARSRPNSAAGRQPPLFGDEAPLPNSDREEHQ
jgi:hypothetical protein